MEVPCGQVWELTNFNRSVLVRSHTFVSFTSFKSLIRFSQWRQENSLLLLAGRRKKWSFRNMPRTSVLCNKYCLQENLFYQNLINWGREILNSSPPSLKMYKGNINSDLAISLKGEKKYEKLRHNCESQSKGTSSLEYKMKYNC